MSEQPKRPILIYPPNFGFTKSCENCISCHYTEHNYIMCKKYGKIEICNNIGYSETLGCSNCEMKEIETVEIKMDFYKSL
jgi:hypothetical protein